MWHVNDLKISHVNKDVVTDIIKSLSDKYETTPTCFKTPLALDRGKKHEYLGMLLDYTIDGKVVIDMREYIKKYLKNYHTHFKDLLSLQPPTTYLT